MSNFNIKACAFVGIFFLLGIVIAINVNSATDYRITVEAEGSGATKMEALKSAWQNAVREAVGMYMTSKTDVLNDDITEQIAAYSRGNVDSFQIISQIQQNGVWIVKISANVDKDIIHETMAQSSKSNIKIDGASLAAQVQSVANRNNDAIDVLLTSGLLDFSKCLDYSATLEQHNIKGEQYIYIRHILKMDINNFKQHSKEFEKIIGAIAESKELIPLNSKSAKEALEIIEKNKYDIKIHWNNRFLSPGNTPIGSLAIFYPYMSIKCPYRYHEDMFLNQHHYGNGPIDISYKEPFFYFNDKMIRLEEHVCVASDAFQARCYKVNSKIFNEFDSRLNEFTVRFQVCSDKDCENIISMTPELAISFHSINRNTKTILFSPMLVTPTFNNYSIFVFGQYCVLIFFEKLDINSEQLMQLTELSTQYILTPKAKTH